VELRYSWGRNCVTSWFHLAGYRGPASVKGQAQERREGAQPPAIGGIWYPRGGLLLC